MGVLAVSALCGLRPLAAQPPCLIPKTEGPAALQALPETTESAELPPFTQVEVKETPAELRQALEHGRLKDAPLIPWVEPPRIDAVEGLIDTPLVVDYAEHELNGQPVKLRNYYDPKTGQGMLTGPTLRFPASERARTLRVLLQNHLPCPPGEDCRCDRPGHVHGPDKLVFNITNLHTHGLHVSPQPPQDDVLLNVMPGCSSQVEVKIPAGHLPGTFWYHAHRHGSTAIQLSSGMAGALIVEGRLDAELRQRGIGERLFVFQQISHKNGALEHFEDIGRNAVTSINGQINPDILLKSGQVERWRFINGGFEEVLPLALVRECRVDEPGCDPAREYPLYLIAVDGITIRSAPQPKTVVQLAAGNRADVLVKLTEPGRYRLVKVPGRRVEGETESLQYVATVEVAPQGTDMPIPQSLPVEAPPDIDASQAIPRPPVVFSVKEGDEEDEFLIDGRKFSMDQPAYTPKLNTVEAWTVYNCSTQMHPFHIHVNPFQVTEIGEPEFDEVIPYPPGRRIWHDTLIIPQGVVRKVDGKDVIIPGHIKMLTHYEYYTGRFVLHCHILTHEDKGMMALVEIKP
jgi:FtsP/CotA-like multicopper oxidase with cupredoxin domain